MKIGVYGSTFNPVTNGHLWLANSAAKKNKLDKVMVLPASGNRPDKATNIADFHRVEMLKLAIQGNALFELDLREMQTVQGLQYSYYTMRALQEANPEAEFFFLMGADLLLQLPKWVQAEKFIPATKFIVMERQNISLSEVIERHNILKKNTANFWFIGNNPLEKLSSSYIRQEFYVGNDPRYLLPEAVYNYILQNRLYSKEENR